MNKRVIAWWSGGITSAMACLLAIKKYENVEVVFMDTKRNEHSDTYRFLRDCEKLYNKKIEILSNPKYNTIWDVWKKFLSLNTAHGAICSTELKRYMREQYQKPESDYAQIFGFEYKKKEINRHKNMRRNYPEINALALLIDEKLNKNDCINYFLNIGIDPPKAYQLGYENNNCLESGCVQGGIGYWQKFKIDYPDAFDKMALFEHKLTNLKGKPVTILKDQSKNGGLVFLRAHPYYPEMKDLSMMKGRKPIALMECHGFCGTKD